MLGGELEELSRPAHSPGSEPAALDDDMAGVNPALRLLAAAESDGPGDPYPGPESLLASYRRLADVFHDILAEQSLDALLDRYVEQIRGFRANVVDIPIRSGQAYSYKLIFAAKGTRGGSPWMTSVHKLKSNLTGLTADDVVRALREIRAKVDG